MNTSRTHFVLGAVVLIILGVFIGMFINPKTATSPDTNDIVATTTEAIASSTESDRTPATPSKKPTAAPSVTAQKTPAAEARAMLLAVGNTQCVYEQVSGNTRSTNTLFLSGGKARGEFRSLTSGENKGTIMVYDGIQIYTWTEGMASGQKTTLKAVSDIARLIPNDTSLAMIFGKPTEGVSWNCFPWIVDQAKLAAPKYIAF